MHHSALAILALAASGHALQPRCDKNTCSSSVQTSAPAPAPIETPSTTAPASISCADCSGITWVTYTVTHKVDYCPETTSSVTYDTQTYTSTENEWTQSITSTLPTWVPISNNITSTLTPLTSGHKCQYPSCDKTLSASWTSTAKPTSIWTAPPKPSITQHFESAANRYTASGVAGAVLAGVFFALY